MIPDLREEHETGFEPATLALARRYSTTEPLVHICKPFRDYFLYIKTLSGCLLYVNAFRRKAGDGNRTHVSSLEG